MNKPEFLEYLHNGDITNLFLSCGWNEPTNTYDFDVAVGEEMFTIHEAAQKGVRVYSCAVDKVPLTAVRRALDAKLRKSSSEYMLVFLVSPAEGETMHHFWMVPVKGVDKRDIVSIEYVSDDQANFLLDKVNAITFAPDEDVTIMDVVDRITKTFLVNAADVTKKFYQGFRNQHKAFVKAIENIDIESDREWYASVMLNRLMFCYFIQKKGFLDLDTDYLGRKLREVRAKKGEDKFYQSFYRSFLKQLFSDGLDKPVAERSEYFLKKYGRIPYLNGGMFAKHSLEKTYKELDIPDKVFEDLFAFFDQWCWHLDTKLTATGRDINPDVLGYIFEQYINDRAQMGAYYTKEDITEYIGRNTIVPYVMETVSKKLPESFTPKGEVWGLLKASKDKYIFAAVKKGVKLELPDYIEKGVDTTKPKLKERRTRWNEKADEAYALPTEIWRETVARRQRYAEVKEKIQKGEITDIHDFITYNLDIRSFVEDVIRNTQNLELVKAFYGVLREVTILDPTCGSGAFLFAALNILEPLYEACLDRMEENERKFKTELDEIKGKFRSNRQYFIYKNIILRNLYGVDIMREATEIARLRLFLKMVAVVDVDEFDPNLGLDPLPDIDFNVKCGNTLVGYASEKEIQNGLLSGDMFAFAELKGRIDEEMEKASSAFEYFRKEQLNLLGDHEALLEAKHEVNLRLDAIRSLLDNQIYDHHAGKKKADWIRDVQPFHWYTEFYPIMHNRGGFDVIIGNPPYVSKSKITYLKNVEEFKCSDIYGYVIRRVYQLLQMTGHHGFIVMHNLAFSSDFADVRKLIYAHSTIRHFSFYSRIPSGLFSGDCRVRNSIYIASRSTGTGSYTTRLHRWYQEQRDSLFQSIGYSSFSSNDVIPMSGNEELLAAMHPTKGTYIEQITGVNFSYDIYFKKLAYNFLSISEEEAPCYYPNKKKAPQTTINRIGVDSILHKDLLILLFSGRFYFAKWCVFGDDLNYTKGELLDYRFPFDELSDNDVEKLHVCIREIKKRARSTIQYKLNAGKYVGTYNTSKLWDITDQSDAIFLKYICDDPVNVQENLFLFVSQMAVTMKKDAVDSEDGE